MPPSGFFFYTSHGGAHPTGGRLPTCRVVYRLLPLLTSGGVPDGAKCIVVANR